MAETMTDAEKAEWRKERRARKQGKSAPAKKSTAKKSTAKKSTAKKAED